MRISDYIDADLLDRFEFYNYNHAIEIITQAFPKEWSDVVECLRKLDITTDDLREAGGNETKIPKKFDDVLRIFFPFVVINAIRRFMLIHLGAFKTALEK